jgi:uncharacterized protein
MADDSLTARLVKILRADPDVMHVLVTLRGLALPDWRLVSGAIYQSVWNVLTDKPRGHGIRIGMSPISTAAIFPGRRRTR